MSSIDRLSDDVICHILSFLPTRISASTNVLSKRWRFMWAHVPNLNFKGDDFEDETRASDIITRAVVLHRAKTIITFRLFDDVSCTFYQLATWIAHAVNRGVRNLNLDFESFTPPRCLLTCTTLVDLKLRRCRGIIPSAGNLLLPSLKKLHLSQIMYENEESLPRLLSGCPVLEDLIVEGCFKDKQIVSAFDVDVDDLSCVFVSSLTLKTFSVDLSLGCRVLKINAPSLVYLEVKNCYWEDFTSLGTMTSLIGAHFSLIGDWAEYVRVLQFLNSLCNVKCLKFSIIDHYRKGVSIPRLDSLVKFDNLTKLEFNLLVDFDEIVKFLQVADNLQVLKFTLCGMHKTYREPKKVPTCMLSRLKTVQIKLSDGFHARDFKTIKYLLRNAQVLETMEICDKSYHCFKKKRLGMLRRISLLEKGSESCQLVFNNPMFL